MYAENPKTCAHHKGIGLTHKVGRLSGCHLDRRNHRPAGRNNAVFGRPGEVAVRADELRALEHQPHGLENVLVVIGVSLADDDIVGVNVVHRNTFVVKRHDKPCAANDIRAASGRLRADEPRRGQCASVEVALVHIQTHAAQLLLQFLRRALRRVRQEQEVLVLPIEPVDKFLDARQKAVAVIDHAVHVADEAVLRAQRLKLLL